MAERVDTFVAKFEGGLAESHRLPAYDAARSFYGISRSLTIVTNYLVEGRVRRKEFDRQPFQIELVAQKPGSFDSVFQIISDPAFYTAAGAFGLAAGGGAAGNLLSDFIKGMFKRSIGEDAPDSIEKLEAEDKLKAGDLAAVVDALEPAMRDVHQPINRGVGKITIIGNNNKVVFNSSSKEYVNSSIDDSTLKARLFSVASFNANSGYGRVYDTEERRTIPFQLPKGIDRTSVNKVLESMTNYTRLRWTGGDEKSLVAFRYTTRVSVDDRVKMIFPEKVRTNISDL